MGKTIRLRCALAAVILLLAAVHMSGCGKSDVSLVKNSSYGNNEETVGEMLEHYNLFTSKSWSSSVDKSGRHVVTFIGVLPADRVIKAATTDREKWLSIEKKYSAAVLPSVTSTSLMITFLITSHATFDLGEMRLGVSSGQKTEWSPDIRKKEKEMVAFYITRNSPEIIPILAPYADPSTREGSNLYARLTGKTLESFQTP